MSAAGRFGAALFVVSCLALVVPESAIAAPPNQLVNPRVSPGAGSTTTAFTFAVDYVSNRDHGATNVMALVAGQSVVLGLTSGTPTGGSYTGVSTLSAGTWAVTFEAQATQGPSPSLAGPTVSVTAPVPTAPPPPPPPEPVPAPAAPAATPVPAAPSASAPLAQPLVSTPASPPSSAGPQSADGGVPSTPSQATGTAGPRPNPSVTGGPETSRVTNNYRVGEEGSPMAGIVAIVAAGLAGAVLFARRGGGQAAVTESGGMAVRSDARLSTADAARRRRGTSLGTPAEDPILAAMGLGTQSGSEHVGAPVTRNVSTGPGERLTSTPTVARDRR